MKTWEISFTKIPKFSICVEANSFEEAASIARSRPETRDAVMSQTDYMSGVAEK